MKNCKGCIYAKWEKTKTGRLHPSGDGNCMFKIKIPELPVSMYWLFSKPRPTGGFINRHNGNREHCSMYDTGQE